MNDKELSILKNRLLELSRRSQSQNIFCFTEFLGLAQQDVFYSIKKELSGTAYTAFGGNQACERVMIRFGDPEELGYEEDFPIVVLKIYPSDKKDKNSFSHRDVLGACMNLGISRGTLGDIFIKDGEAYLFCSTAISGHIQEELYKIRHAPVRCQLYEGDLSILSPLLKKEQIRVATERLDSVISKLYHLSREDGQTLFKKNKVFINGRQCTNLHASPGEGDIISVRGYGRFIYSGITGSTKKDKLIVEVLVYSMENQ